jgi:DNA-binding response OmpR family regulator
VHEISDAPVGPSEQPSRILTCLLVEPDADAERRLLALLAARGHRAIPVSRAEEAVEMVQRMQFDVMFCAWRLPGLNWLEVFQRVRRRVGSFVLMTETRDPEAIRVVEQARGRVLPRPVQERDLDDFLPDVERTLAEKHAWPAS